MSSSLRLALPVLLAAMVCQPVHTQLAALQSNGASKGAVGFNRDVRPILANKCFACHGPDEKQRKADLRLDIAEGPFANREDGGPVIVAGDLRLSELHERITASEPDSLMPPKDSGKELYPEEIATLTRWIAEGAHYEKHWAFIKPELPAEPQVSDASWVKNAIDRFVLARLDTEGIDPSPEAEPVTLLRRVYLDLVGLLPSPEDVEQFVRNPSDAAYASAVDQLLASPHFGERWGRHWLDVARYADSNGYSVDSARSIWKYRDWVIDAFNADKPFDEFVIEQLAGDLLPNATIAQRIATGFHRNTMINQEGGIDEEEFRLKAVIDRVNTTGSGFLGLTLGCAQCHSHKYDPFTQEEYFSLFAFFNGDDEYRLEVPTPGQLAARDSHRNAVRNIEHQRREYLKSSEKTDIPNWERELDANDVGSFDAETQAALRLATFERSLKQKRLVRETFAQKDERALQLKKEIETLRKKAPGITSTLALKRRDNPRETFIHIQGDFTRPGVQVGPGFPKVLHAVEPKKEDMTRLDLAKWLAHRDNPLTARVTVNRFWQRLFGRGLVETENDFGIQGTLPTHPELLDWLATEFPRRDWSVKEMLRLMVISATYRQASHQRPDLAHTDPSNLLLARQSRLRMEAEVIRDSALVASGLFNARIGGPGVFPPQPEGVMNLGQQNRPWRVSEGADRYRRGMYTFFWRATPYPAMTVFDAPEAMTSCTRRVRSNTPLQALTLLNDATFYEFAEALATKVLNEAPPNRGERIRHAFRLCLSREPSAEETEILTQLLDAANPERKEVSAWTTVARALMNSDEFMTRE